MVALGDLPRRHDLGALSRSAPERLAALIMLCMARLDRRGRTGGTIDKVDEFQLQALGEASIAFIRYLRLSVLFVGSVADPQKNLVETITFRRGQASFFSARP